MTNKIGTWGFALSVAALFVIPLTLILGLAGLIMSIIGVVKASKDPAGSGKVLSIIGIVIGAIALVLGITIYPIIMIGLFAVFAGVAAGVPDIGAVDTSTGASAMEQVYWEMSTIGVADTKMSMSGEDTLTLKNNQAVDIEVTSIALGANQYPIDAITILKGQSKDITGEFGCAGASEISETLTVTYADKQTGNSYDFVSDYPLTATCIP